MLVLGLNAFHADLSAALLRDGKLIAAAEEERFRRLKHWAGFPTRAIAYCLSEAGVQLSDVNHVAFNQDSRAHLLKKMRYVLTKRPDINLIINRLRNCRARAGILDLLEAGFPGQSFKGKLHPIEHHLAHLSSAFHVSLSGKQLLSRSTASAISQARLWGTGYEGQISSYGRVYFPHSLGIFYQALTQYLGFPHYGDEYKVMGLAPTAEPTIMEVMREIVQLLAGWHLCTRSALTSVIIASRLPINGRTARRNLATCFRQRLRTCLGRAASQTIRSKTGITTSPAQCRRCTRKRFFICSNAAYSAPVDRSCACRRLRDEFRRQRQGAAMTPFRRVYVQAAAGDAGGAIGAAFALWHKLGGDAVFVMDHAYWGPRSTTPRSTELLASAQSRIATPAARSNTLLMRPHFVDGRQSAIADGKVVGWFQGRMEWGPRALGNRSIVCDPRRADMKAVLNAKIKRRESFRPFAPSVLEEAVAEWFEEDDAVPFMMQVFQIREEKRQLIPAVTHVDGSGRLQTVSARTNPRLSPADRGVSRAHRHSDGA